MLPIIFVFNNVNTKKHPRGSGSLTDKMYSVPNIQEAIMNIVDTGNMDTYLKNTLMITFPVMRNKCRS